MFRAQPLHYSHMSNSILTGIMRDSILRQESPSLTTNRSALQICLAKGLHSEPCQRTNLAKGPALILTMLQARYGPSPTCYLCIHDSKRNRRGRDLLPTSMVGGWPSQPSRKQYN